MASVSQLEAFDWWLDQNREERTAARLCEVRGVPFDTARRWVTAFNKRLVREVERSVSVKLNHYVDEYEEVQRLAMQGTVTLSVVYSRQAEKVGEMAQNGEPIDLVEVGRITSGLRTVYQLAERASGADMTKKLAMGRDMLKRDSEFRLPVLDDVLKAFANEVDPE